MRHHTIILISALLLVAAGSFVPVAPPPAAARPVGGSGEPLLVQEGVTPPEILVKVQPEYPEDARKAGAEGKIILEAVIDEQGAVSDLKTLRRIPEFPSLEESARQAVSKWRYKPATWDGAPVAVYFTVVVEFTLEGREIPELARLEDHMLPVMLRFQQQPLSSVFRALEGVWGHRIELQGEGPYDTEVSMEWKDISLKVALERLAVRYRLRYEVMDPRTLAVTRVEGSDRPDSP